MQTIRVRITVNIQLQDIHKHDIRLIITTVIGRTGND